MFRNEAAGHPRGGTAAFEDGRQIGFVQRMTESGFALFDLRMQSSASSARRSCCWALGSQNFTACR
jgi:hypothetical protein